MESSWSCPFPRPAWPSPKQHKKDLQSDSVFSLFFSTSHQLGKENVYSGESQPELLVSQSGLTSKSIHSCVCSYSSPSQNVVTPRPSFIPSALHHLSQPRSCHSPAIQSSKASRLSQRLDLCVQLSCKEHNISSSDFWNLVTPCVKKCSFYLFGTHSWWFNFDGTSCCIVKDREKSFPSLYYSFYHWPFSYPSLPLLFQH